jgi:hypothetical protein
MRFIQNNLFGFLLLWGFLFFGLQATSPTLAAEDNLTTHIGTMAAANFTALSKQIEALAATGDPRVVPILEALAKGRLFFRKSDKKVVFATKVKRRYKLSDPLSGDTLGEVKKSKVKKNSGQQQATPPNSHGAWRFNIIVPGPKGAVKGGGGHFQIR